MRQRVECPTRARDANTQIVVLVVLVSLLAGCAAFRESAVGRLVYDPDARYHLKTVLFDGVPDPNAPTPEEIAKAEAAAAAAGGDHPLHPSQELARLRKAVVHAPVADRECEACHTFSGRRSSNPAIQSVDLTGYGEGESGNAALLAPLVELCVSCHDEYAVATTQKEGAWLHGPVASGECTFCHHAHRSQFDSLLRRGSPRTLCVQCHVPALLEANAEHPEIEDTDCTECHDPHKGASRFLL